MKNLLRQSTTQTIRFGPFLDSTDFVTAETALTIAQADRQLSKDGGAFAQSNHTGNSTHDTDGWYSDDLNATDTNTLGILLLQVVVAGALPVWLEFMVVPAVVYDTLVAGTDDLNTQVAGMDAGVVTAAAIATGAIDADAIAANAIGSSELATTAVNEIRDAILSDSTAFAGANINATISSRMAEASINTTAGAVDTVTTNTDMRGTDNAALASVATEARLAELDAANMPTDLANIETDTQDIQARLPAALISGRMNSDVEAINDSTEAAQDLAASAATIVRGTAQTGTLSTTQMTSNVAEATDDHFIGRILIWTSGVLKDQATDITDYAGANGLFTFTATTEAPANNDTFVVV